MVKIQIISILKKVNNCLMLLSFIFSFFIFGNKNMSFIVSYLILIEYLSLLIWNKNICVLLFNYLCFLIIKIKKKANLLNT